MEEMFREVLMATFIDIAQELQEYSNRLDELEADISTELVWKGNQIEVHSYAHNLWVEDVEYGAPDVVEPTHLSYLGVLENLSEKDSSKYTEIRILMNTPTHYWQGFIKVVRRKYLILNDEMKTEYIRADKPWLRIPDHLWDRDAVRLWWEGNTAREIAQELESKGKANVKHSRIRNRLSELRKVYPAEVPLSQERRSKPPP